MVGKTLYSRGNRLMGYLTAGKNSLTAGEWIYNGKKPLNGRKNGLPL
jgi:hypothetical protein